MTVALASGATLVALAFAASLFEQWRARRRRHHAAWGLSLALFAAGSLALWSGASMGWDEPTFRLFYLFGAVLNVPVLAVGTIYLLGGRRNGDTAALVVALAGAFAAGVVISAPLRAPIEAGVLPQGSDVFGPLPRVLAAVASGGGAAVVIIGALASAVRLWRRRSEAETGERIQIPPRRLAAANTLIAVGTLILSGSGLLNGVLGEMDAFSVTLTIGVSVLFFGFLSAAPPLDHLSDRRTSFPPKPVGTSSTKTTSTGHL